MRYSESHLNNYWKILRYAFAMAYKKTGTYNDPQNGVYNMLLDLDMVAIPREERIRIFDDVRLKILAEAAALKPKEAELKARLLDMCDEKHNQGNKVHPELLARVQSAILQHIIERELADGPENVKLYLDTVKEKIKFYLNQHAEL